MLAISWTLPLSFLLLSPWLSGCIFLSSCPQYLPCGPIFIFPLIFNFPPLFPAACLPYSPQLSFLIEWLAARPSPFLTAPLLYFYWFCISTFSPQKSCIASQQIEPYNTTGWTMSAICQDRWDDTIFLGRNYARDELEAHSVWPLNSFWIELLVIKYNIEKKKDSNAWFNVIWPFEAAKKKNNIHVASIFVFVLNLTASEKHYNSESWLSSAAVYFCNNYFSDSTAGIFRWFGLNLLRLEPLHHLLVLGLDRLLLPSPLLGIVKVVPGKIIHWADGKIKSFYHWSQRWWER